MSAVEFLLDPWVLIQLPFQPVLFHQWTVALYAETLKFSKEISEFSNFPFPTRLKTAVDCLKKMLNLMSKNISLMTELMFKYFGQPGTNLHKLSEICLRVGMIKLPELLPIIEFVLSDECRNIIRALKRLAWNKSTKISVEINNCMGASFGHSNFYCYEFWKQETVIKSLFTIYNQKLGLRNPKPMSTKEKSRIMEAMKKVVYREIIKTGRLKGESRQRILKALDDCFLNDLYESYLEYAGE